MKNLGHYLNLVKNWFKQGWHFLFTDTDKIKAHHLIAFLLTILIIYLLSYIIARIFKTVLMVCTIIAVVWLLYMLLFDRSKFKELFGKGKSGTGGSENSNEDD